MFTLAIAYLSLPIFIVLFTFFSTPFVILSSISLVVFIFCLHNSWQNTQDKNLCWQYLIKYWQLMLFILILTAICIVFPIDVWDWEKHFAVMNTLVESSWPPVVDLNEETWFLRYCIAWYILPALLAKLFGLQFITLVTVIWTATGLFIAMLLAFHNISKSPRLLKAVLIFLVFSGLDIVGALLNNSLPALRYPQWPQTWVGWGEMWPVLTGIAWIPQHLIGASIGACLFLYNRRVALQYSGLIAALVFLWSPFCALGLLPLGIWALAKEGYKTALTLQNLVVAPLILTPLIFYGIQGAQGVPFMLGWEFHKFTFSSYVIFCIVEFLLILSILYYAMPKQRFLIATLAVFLTLLSLLVRDVTFNNLLMRGSMPAVWYNGRLSCKTFTRK